MTVETLSAPAPVNPHERVFVGFSTTSALLSRVIRKISGAAYSHAFLCHGNPLWQGAWVTQASLPTVHSWPYDVAARGWSRVMIYEVTPQFRSAMLKGMEGSRDLFEADFGVVGLVGSAIRALRAKWTRRRTANPLALPGQLFCSQFVQTVLMASGNEAFARWDPKSSSPAQVYNVCGKEHGLFKRRSRAEFMQWLSEVGMDLNALNWEIVRSKGELRDERRPPKALTGA
jgi:hypothetical protein